MKRLLIILLLFILNNELVIGQNNCGCETSPNYNSFISCDTIEFDNSRKLYRQFNCDSSWLTFEIDSLHKKILFSIEKRLIDLTPKLGYQFVKEYSKTVLFINCQSSGGGYPKNYELINKENGEVFKKLGPILYYSRDDLNEFVVTLKIDTIPLIVFYNLKTGIVEEHPISEEVNDLTISIHEDMFPETHFKDAFLANGIFRITYNYKNNINKKKWLSNEIIIEIGKNNR